MMKQTNKGVTTCGDTNALRTIGEAYIIQLMMFKVLQTKLLMFYACVCTCHQHTVILIQMQKQNLS